VSALHTAIDELRKRVWRHAGSYDTSRIQWQCTGCGAVCVDAAFGVQSRTGHACSLTRTIDEAETELFVARSRGAA